MHKLKFAVLLTIFIAALSSIHAQETEAQVAITLERTPCFGSCPVYTVSILDDGTVIYEGENFVDVTGEQIGQIDPEVVEQMVDALEEAGYFEWDEAYDTRTVSDLPTITTSVTRDGETHQIVRYAGDSSAPFALPYLEQWIDVMANTPMWTGVQPEIANVPTMNPPAVTLERTPCFGFCPVYQVAMFDDGTGVFVGIANVNAIGVHTFEIDPSFIENIKQQAEIFGYFGWEDEYTEYLMTDQSTVISSVQTPDQYKHIVRYEGDPNAPIGLTWLENSIDQVLPLDLITAS